MQLAAILQASNSTTSTTATFGNFAPFCQSIPSLDVCNLFLKRLARDPVESSDILLPSCQIKLKGVDGGKGNIALAAVSGFVIIMTAFMCMRVYQRKQANGRREMLVFICTYFATLPLQIVTMGAFLPSDSTILSVMTSFKQAFCAAIFWSLISVGLVMAGVFRSGGTISVLFSTATYLGSFVLALCLSLDTAFGIFHKGKVSTADLINRPILFADLLVFPIVALLLFLILVTISFARSRNWKPFVWTLFSGALWVSSQAIQLLASLPFCRYTNSKVDGSFLSVAVQAVSVWSLLRAHWSLTEDDHLDYDEDPDSDDPRPEPLYQWQGEQNSSNGHCSDWKGKDEEQMLPGGWDSSRPGNNGMVEKGWRSGWSIQEHR